MKKIHPKMKALELSQYFSHYRSMGIFPDAQGQLTHKSLVGSCRISKPFKMLWLFLLSTRIKMIQSKMKELEWSQRFSHYKSLNFGKIPSLTSELAALERLNWMS